MLNIITFIKISFFCINEIPTIKNNILSIGQVLKIKSVDDFNFEDVDIALFSAGSNIAKKFGPIAGKKGCIVIDNSSCFRMDDQVPLIVPEVNP